MGIRETRVRGLIGIHLTSDFRSGQVEDRLKLGGYQTWPEGPKQRGDSVSEVTRQAGNPRKQSAGDICSFFLTSPLSPSGGSMLILL